MSTTEVREEMASRIAPYVSASNAGRPNKAEMEFVQRYNLAIWRLMHGKGDMRAELSIVTRLSPMSIDRRCYRIESRLTDEEREFRDKQEVAASDLSYLQNAYGRNKNPAVQEFIREMKMTSRDSIRRN